MPAINKPIPLMANGTNRFVHAGSTLMSATTKGKCNRQTHKKNIRLSNVADKRTCFWIKRLNDAAKKHTLQNKPKKGDRVSRLG